MLLVKMNLCKNTLMLPVTLAIPSDSSNDV